MDGGPDAEAAEQVVAVDFADIRGVVLEPLEVHPADTLDRMLRVLVVPVEIQAEMDVPILPALVRPPAGRVAFQAQPRLPDLRDLAPLPVFHVADDELPGVVVLVVGGEQCVPLLLGDGNVDFRDDRRVEDVADGRGPVHIVGIVLHRTGIALLRIPRMDDGENLLLPAGKNPEESREYEQEAFHVPGDKDKY